MELKHFSHNHGLIVYQVNQGTEVNCSGCNLLATGTVYVCWPCNFFLHEFCFNASRSMNHPAHPLHPLTLVPYPTYPSNSFYCNSCSLVGTGLSYGCSNCDFDLHVHCAYIPTSAIHNPQTHMPTSHVIHNPQTYDVDPNNSLSDQTSSIHHPQQANLPPVDVRGDPTMSYDTKNEATPFPLETYHSGEVTAQSESYPIGEVAVQSEEPVVSENTGGNGVKPHGLKHFSHSHPLYLYEVEEDDPLVCSGCEQELIGAAYCCSKSSCEYYLHKECFELPSEIRHKSHTEHPLTLASAYYRETGNFTCDACFGVGTGLTYNCSTCDYDLHVSCSSLPEAYKCDHHEHELSLIYSSPISEKEKEEQPGITFSCDICTNVVPENYWLYYCTDCEYGTHLGCVHEEKYEGQSVVIDHQAQMQIMQFQMNMARQNAQFIMSMGQSLANL